jgi:hypothetical protein
MIYTVTYYRHDKKITDNKSYNTDTMKQAVLECVNHAKLQGVKISAISCTVKGSNRVQRFCDVCLKTEAMYRCKDKTMKCKECRK